MRPLLGPGLGEELNKPLEARGMYLLGWTVKEIAKTLKMEEEEVESAIRMLK